LKELPRVIRQLEKNGELIPHSFHKSKKKGMQLTAELKETTEAVHQATEKKMILTLKGITTDQDYVQMLNWLYGFYAPMEEAIRRQLTPENFPDIIKRSRAELILWDIKEFHTEAPKPEFCRQLPVIDTYARALGALYVLEGSTLGGRIIAGMVSRQLCSTKGLSFFNSYGAETGNMWQSFKDFIDRPWSPEQRQEIIAGAEDTFITFKNWIDKHELQPQL
jgi:heme oxygenase